MSSRTISVYMLRHERTGLLLAESDDLPGLHVIARSEEEMRERIPAAIRELLEFQGTNVRDVVPVDEPDGDDSGFVRSNPTCRFEAHEAA